ncbi:hypothetical protein F5J12DRAFT_844899 [Pisolithus orientalis]|uniref:uncharacterized protein n=1 Tax=Pisolithus orientalis TaxID=936130 RepID=UPI002225A477|nr:uncharacterized protein F5J12DRAFT_844899 [Pisolithus orientalis]KAI6001088.1 hypothetical protein F5J12DRAFT_844899 [Pisolithus orientalis]
MSDGTRLRQTWSDALSAAETNFRQLLASYSSNEWKHVPLPQDAPSPRKGKSRAASLNPELRDVAVHRKVTKSGEYVYRAVLDVPATDENAAMDVWKAIITTPEIRQEWDPAVDASQLVELFDQRTRITKTRFTLGWPANPRDAVTISRLHQNASTIIDISTSLPRSADDPTYLRPSPPYVRSNVALFTWWIQVLPQSPLQQSSSPAEQLKRRLSIVLSTPVLRITCFWQHDLRALWNFNSSASICQQLSTMVLGLYKTVKTRGSRVPMLSGHGYGVSIERMRFQLDRQALTIEYAIHPEDDATDSSGGHSLDEIREYRRLTRSVECHLPASEGWDVQLSIKASSDKAQKLPWSASAVRHRSDPSIPTGKPFELIVLHVTHASLPDTHSILKVRVAIELSGPSCGIRLNGIPQTIQSAEERDSGTSVRQQQQILQDASSAANVSFHTTSSVSSVGTIGSGSTPSRTITLNTADRSATAEKSILARVRRSYIYFSSLLQEPEAKWKRTTEARGVSVTQLDSIDPTLVVYRAEATFVGLGLWDLYSALVSPGARVFWDKQHDDANLLEDVNELTELWHFKTKPAWPVVGRDAVLLKTVYKSPTTIHVFSFSADDPYLFPSLPLLDPSIIRTQVDLQGWAIEALNPTTTQLTLLEQSDPKGWSNKAMTIPSQMVAAVAGVGDFVIKCGGPPVVTRLSGARATEMRYEHEKGTFRVAYERAEGRRGGTSPGGAGLNSTSGDADNGGNDLGASSSSVHTIECEIRCDMDTWASALDIVVDPPPQNVIALRRHRLSEGGGGLWLTLSHDALFAADERLLAIVRRGPMASARDKGVVMVNGARVSVDVEELAETEIRALSKRKRVKPLRIPLDQPPVVSVIRRLRAEWDADEPASPTDGGPTTKPPTPDPAEQPQPKSSSTTTSSGWLSAPRFSSPLASFWSSAVDQATSTTQSAVAAVTPSTAATAIASVPSSSMVPMQHVLEALHWLRESQVHQEDGWTLVTDKGLAVQRKVIPEISPAIPVHKGEKVIEGVSAEEVSSIVTSYDCRKQWDDRFGSAIVFESFGAGCHTAFVVSKCGFPFRDRGFYLSSLMARAKLPQRNFDATPGEAGLSQDHRNVIFCVSASFHPESVSSFSSEKYNSYGYPIGRVFIDGWILETLDPYTKENYAIPSTRCTRIVAVDYAGSVPVAMNSMINAALPRSILAVETYIKGSSPLPLTRLPATGLVLTESKSAEVAPPGVVAVTGGGSPSWKLKRRDENRILVGSTYDPTTRTYNSSIFLTMSSQPRPEEATSRVSRVLTGATGTTPDARQGGRTEYAASPNPSSDRGEPSSSPVRSRSTERAARSSAFTIKGELKQSTDLVVAEVLVDSKLYPEGYSVQITSGLRDGSKFVSLTARSASSDGSTFRTAQMLLPVASSLYTVPASPLHSSGLNADRPPRHLLRLTLPTAQFQISTVQDPLTGETRSAPPKPQWLLDLQSKGFTVQIEIGPGNGARKNGGGATVNVNGTATAVVSEKESLTALGRDELQDDRVSRMPVVQRCGEDGDVFPEELQVPLARAEELLDRAAGVHATDIIEDPKTPEGDGLSEEDTDKSQGPESPENGVDAQGQVPSGSEGLLGFLNAYPNTLTRWATSAVRGTTTGSAMQVDGEEVLVVNVPPPGSTRTMLTARTYPLSTVLIIAMIGFLIGSLLRSLLSPADFIYVVTDVRDAEEVSKGWREIRRLMEIKYIVGGWDFQIAVVRRH